MLYGKNYLDQIATVVAMVVADSSANCRLVPSGAEIWADLLV
jgi:hypothetical protein